MHEDMDRKDTIWRQAPVAHGGPHGCAVTYYTRQPAPTQWVAIGLATPVREAAARGDAARHLLVGSGRTEHEAIAALRSRCGPWNEAGESCVEIR